MNSDFDLSVDFSRKTGKINRNQHGSNFTPPLYPRTIIHCDEECRAMHFASSRTHDWALVNHGQRVIDTHFIFPLMKLDPADPSNYYFKATDAIIKICQDTGMKVFYRLGTSIEHTLGEHFNAITPDDFGKYAEVLAGIVRHYTAGWADGFQYDIQYWEIWNEPDCGPCMWSASLDDYIPFFVTVLKRLKSEFPHLKIGGPALCWLNQDFFRKMLTACKEAGVLPDFISWHCYTADPGNLIAQPAAARAMLKDLGMEQIETCINEWHYIISWSGVHSATTHADLRESVYTGPSGMEGIDSAAFNAAVLAGWQGTDLDSAFYYGSGVSGNWGFWTTLGRLNKNYFSMKMFGRFVHECTERTESLSRNKNIYCVAGLSADGKHGALVVSDYCGPFSTIEVEVKGLEDSVPVRVRILDDDNDDAPADFVRTGSRITLKKNRYGSAVFMVEFDR